MKLLRRSEVEARLGISKAFFYRLVRERRLVSSQISEARGVRVFERSVHEYVDPNRDHTLTGLVARAYERWCDDDEDSRTADHLYDFAVYVFSGNVGSANKAAACISNMLGVKAIEGDEFSCSVLAAVRAHMEQLTAA